MMQGEDSPTMSAAEQSTTTPKPESSQPKPESIQTLEVVQSPPNRLQAAPEGQMVHQDVLDRGNLEKVRDILFGSQIRKHETQFDQLEKHLDAECMSLRTDINKRLDQLETYVQREIASLADQLRETKLSQNAAVEKLVDAQRTVTQALDKKIEQLNQKSIETERSLRRQLLEQSKTLSDDIRQKSEDLLASLDREVQGLNQANKSDRDNLAAFFGELALRLKADQ